MARHQIESYHGVMMRINNFGVLIIGQPNIGKSSFALELLHHGHQLVADDSVDFSLAENGEVIAHCPDMLAGFLHCRDLGLINVSELFGSDAYCHQQKLDFVVELKPSANNAVSLATELDNYLICGKPFPKLSLTVFSPASLTHRLETWLKMQSSTTPADVLFCHRQRRQMALQ